MQQFTSGTWNPGSKTGQVPKGDGGEINDPELTIMPMYTAMKQIQGT